MWEVSAGAVTFVVLFLFLPKIIDAGEGTSGSIVVALLPLIPVLWIAIAVVRHIHRVDEFQRIYVLQSFAIGFGAAMLISLIIAFLSTAGINVAYVEWYVFIGGMSAWGIAIGILSFRASR